MNKSEQKRPDFILLAILLSMTSISLLMIYSSFPLLSSAVNPNTILLKQVIWWILGYGLLSFLFYLGTERIQSSIYVIYYIVLASLALLAVQKYLQLPFLRSLIIPRNGSVSWFTIPGGTIQPSEFMKIILIILIPEIIDKHHKNYPISKLSTDIILVKNVMRYILPPLILTYIQPDSGLTIIMLISIASMLLVSGIRREWIIIGLSFVAFVILVVGITYMIHPDFVINYIIGGSYKLNRIYGWLEPEKYILTFGNQLYTALLAVGSAGIWGYGLQNVPLYIAEAQNDFIYAIVGSSYGLLGSLTVLLLSLSLDFRLIQIGLKSQNTKSKYIIAGLVGILAFQQIENMGMIVGLFPITGITLPFISSGGSSLLSYMIIIAVVMQIFSDIIQKQHPSK